MQFKWIGTVPRLSTQQQILSPKSAPGIPSGAYIPLIGAQQLEKKLSQLQTIACHEVESNNRLSHLTRSDNAISLL